MARWRKRTTMDFITVINKVADAASSGDGAAMAALFAEDGVYHDCFYGSFRGREAIRSMIEDYFHRDGEDFVWDMHDPVGGDGVGYARYVFSYRSKLADHAGRIGMFEGVAIVRYNQAGEITDYREVAETGVGLSLLGFSPERIAKFLARQAKALQARDESAIHIVRA
jgi:ketosteroid isomerase-like protein